jgi:DNA-binding MarR family transcriptional regulator
VESDAIDELIRHWRVERPDLDPEPMAIVGRILRLAVHLENRVNDVLSPFGLALWGFDVLATLRRQGKPYAMTPSELTRSVMLSSGAMTNRVDRLEKLGLVARQPDPLDRRSLRVLLTSKGLKVVDKAIAARFDEGRDALRSLSAKERKELQVLLRKILLAIDR